MAYVARYYDSRTGTFCSADPLAGSPGDPQSWNRYPYGRNDPINVTDPSGKSWLSWLALGGAIVADVFTFGAANAAIGAVEAGEVGVETTADIAMVAADAAAAGTMRAAVNTGNAGQADWSNAMNETLGMPHGWSPQAGTLGDVLGVGTPGCEFGACGSGPSAIMRRGGVTGGAAPQIPQIDWVWWRAFFSAIHWKNISQSQSDAWNKGYYSCIGNHIIPFKGLIGAGLARAGEEGLTSAVEGNSSWFAGAYYHVTDARFTAWGKFSKVLVPRLAGKISAVARGVSVAGIAVTDIELAHAGYECSGMVF